MKTKRKDQLFHGTAKDRFRKSQPEMAYGEDEDLDPREADLDDDDDTGYQDYYHPDKSNP